MKPKHKLIILIVLTTVFSLAFLLMVAVCITMKWEYRGHVMGNEAYGFYSAAFALTCMIWFAHRHIVVPIGKTI